MTRLVEMVDFMVSLGKVMYKVRLPENVLQGTTSRSGVSMDRFYLLILRGCEHEDMVSAT